MQWNVIVVIVLIYPCCLPCHKQIKDVGLLPFKFKYASRDVVYLIFLMYVFFYSLYVEF